MKSSGFSRRGPGAVALLIATGLLVASAAPSAPAQRPAPSAGKRAQTGTTPRAMDRKVGAPGAAAPTGAASKAIAAASSAIDGRLRERVLAGDGLFVRFSELTGRPRVVYGDLGPAPSASRTEDRARIFLQEQADTFGVDLADLETARALETPGGSRVYFAQTYQGLPVFHGEVAVHFDNRGRVAAVTNTYSSVTPKSTKPAVSADDAFDAARASAGVAEADLIAGFLTPAELGVFPTSDGGRLAWRVQVPAREPAGTWEVFVDAQTGTALDEPVNLTNFSDAQARVFQPNPVVSEGDTTLSDSASLPGGAYRTTTLRALDGSGKLSGQFSQIHPSLTTAVVRPSLDFTDITRGGAPPHFDEVQVYWAIEKAHEVFEQLGYGPGSAHPVMNYPVRVYPHSSPSWGNQDNSSFSGSNVDGTGTGLLEFGTGGVDDAEDAEIVWHEYGHAILWNQRPGLSQNMSCEGLGEGFGDYFAVSMSRRINPDPRFLAFVGEWDATSYSSDPVPYLRRVDEPQSYPNSGSNCEVHNAGQTWSHALFDFENAVGPDVALRTVLEANFMLDLSPTQAEAAQAMIAADQSLTGGANRAALVAAFVARGILTGDGGGSSPSVSKVSYKTTTSGPRLVVDGAGFTAGTAVIEVNGVALGGMKYPSKFVTGAVTTRVQSSDRAIKRGVPRGVAVQVTVLNPSTGLRSTAFSYTRP